MSAGISSDDTARAESKYSHLASDRLGEVLLHSRSALLRQSNELLEANTVARAERRREKNGSLRLKAGFEREDHAPGTE